MLAVAPNAKKFIKIAVFLVAAKQLNKSKVIYWLNLVKMRTNICRAFFMLDSVQYSLSPWYTEL